MDFPGGASGKEPVCQPKHLIFLSMVNFSIPCMPFIIYTRELAPLNPTEVFYPQVLSDFYPLLKKNQNFSTSFRQSLAQDTKIPVVSKFSYTLFL